MEDYQTLSVQVWFKFQLTRDLLCWFVPSSLSGSGMCEDGFAGGDAPYAVCPSIDDNPEMPFVLNCHPMVSFGGPLRHVVTLRGQILVSRTDGDFLFSVCFFLRVCVVCWRREGGRVYVQNATRV